MQAIKQRRGCGAETYYAVCHTDSRSAAWAFDRFRLYYPNKCTKVAIFNASGNVESTDKGTKIVDREPLLPPQPFSTTNSFEHDFTFDLSGLTGTVLLGITAPPSEAKFQQLYCYPTGYGATRGKNADIRLLYVDICNPESTGGSHGVLRLDHQPNLYNSFISLKLEGQLNAKQLYVHNSAVKSYELDKIIKALDLNGIQGGVLDYRNTYDSATYNNLPTYPTVDSRAAYDSLLVKKWTVYGTPPPTS